MFPRIAFFFLHHLKTIVEILPYHIQRWDDTTQWVQIALSHPNGQHRVFLAQGLSTRHPVAIMPTDDMPHKELQETDENGYCHHP